VLAKPPVLLVFQNPTLLYFVIELSFDLNSVLVHLVLASSSIACRNYPSGLVDRAPQDREQPLELVYRLLRRSAVSCCSRAVNVSLVPNRSYPSPSKDRDPGSYQVVSDFRLLGERFLIILYLPIVQKKKSYKKIQFVDLFVPANLCFYFAT